MKTFIIGKRKPNTPTGYYLELNWMSGDADAYEDSSIGPIKEEDFDSLSALIDWIEEYINFDHNSKCRDSYKVLNDYSRFVDTWPSILDQNKFTIEWQHDVTCEGELASLYDYRMFYIDGFGCEFEVTIK